MRLNPYSGGRYILRAFAKLYEKRGIPAGLNPYSGGRYILSLEGKYFTAEPEELS